MDDELDEDDDWPEDDFDDLDLEDVSTTKKPSNRRSLLIRIAALVAIVLILVVAFILLTGGDDDSPDATDVPTSVAQGAATATVARLFYEFSTG